MTAPRPDSQRGAAMIVVLIIMAALMTAGGLALYVSSSETKSTGYIAAGRQALYCAEAGLAAARATITANYAQWGQVLDTDDSNDPSWYPITGHLGDDPTAPPDYEVRIRDNDDEAATTNDPTTDSDMQIYVESTCLKYSETERMVTELLQYQSTGYVYRNQSGQGGGNTGNSN